MKRLLRRIRPTKPLKELTWIDLIIITTILCGNAIYTSHAMDSITFRNRNR